jgi:hypothetical protein
MARLPLILLPLIAGCTQATLSFGTDDTPGADTPTDSDRADEQRDLPGAATFEPADDSEDDAVAAFRSALRGDFGEMGQFADDLSDVETTIGPTFSSVTLHTLGDHGWAMLRLELDGQLGHGRLRPGETVYLSGCRHRRRQRSRLHGTRHVGLRRRPLHRRSRHWPVPTSADRCARHGHPSRL